MILDKRVIIQGFNEEEYDFIIGTPINHYGVRHPT